MLIIGLTGGIGSGKSEAASLFSHYGACVIDTDKIAHELTQPGSPTLERIIDLFGPDFLTDEKQLDRRRLSQAVFDDPGKKSSLENILHPEIQKSVEQKIENLTDEPYVILVVPLLLETIFKNLVDRILVIDTTEENQIQRTMNRDGRTRSEVEMIIRGQCSREVRLRYADDIIYNSGSLADLKTAVESLHAGYLSSSEQLQHAE